MSEISPLERVWKHRETTVYPSIFGSEWRGIFVLAADLFSDMFGQDAIDPRWLHYGVYEFAPTPARPSWLFVSSGASNPWETDLADYAGSEYSGFGTELVLETPEQGDWAIIVLQRMLAFNILLAHGRYDDKKALNYGDRIPMRAPITLQGDSLLRNILVTKPTHYVDHFELESGRVDFLHLVGISDREVEYAKAQCSEALRKQLNFECNP